MKSATARRARDAGDEAAPGVSLVTPPKGLGQRRRRPGVMALAVALVAVGGVGGAALFTAKDKRVEVLAVARTVPYGAVVADADVRTVMVSVGGGVQTVSAKDKRAVVGKRAAVELRPDTLIARGQVTDALVLQPDEILVGMALTPGQLPTTPLQPGRKVLVVSTPGKVSDAAKGQTLTPPATVAATVFAVGAPDQSGRVVVDVAVPKGDAATVAARASTELVALVVLQPEARP
ncbi:SAF domain-containing protein [Embleya sp. NPDC055664]